MTVNEIQEHVQWLCHKYAVTIDEWERSCTRLTAHLDTHTLPGNLIQELEEGVDVEVDVECEIETFYPSMIRPQVYLTLVFHAIP